MKVIPFSILLANALQSGASACLSIQWLDAPVVEEAKAKETSCPTGKACRKRVISPSANLYLNALDWR